jgi:3-oxoacyl-[acyl-carrier-protein] synthase-1
MNTGGQLWDGTRADLVICASGALNALGFNPYQTWAFWRAEAVGLGESPFRCANGTRATFAAVSTLPPTSMGRERLAFLADGALAQLSTPLAALPREAKLAALVGVPEPLAQGRNDKSTAQERRLNGELASAISKHLPRAVVRSFALGHASLAFAIREAAAALAAQKIDAALVGGVDSYYDPEAIEILLQQGRLFDGENADSLIPGEGAAFLLIARSAVAKRARLPLLARVEAAATGSEPAGMLVDAPCNGLGLSETLSVITSRLKADRRSLHWLLGDLTNESYRSHEFQLAVARALAPGGLDDAGQSFHVIARDPLRMDFMPLRFGDLGAATMPTAAVVASEAFLRGDPCAENCLLVGSSARESRGAVLLSSVPRAWCE